MRDFDTLPNGSFKMVGEKGDKTTLKQGCCETWYMCMAYIECSRKLGREETGGLLYDGKTRRRVGKVYPLSREYLVAAKQTRCSITNC